MNALYANHVFVNDTVFYNAYKFLLNANYIVDWQIINNLFIGAKERPWYDSEGTSIWDPVALLVVDITLYDPSDNTIIVQYNNG